MSNQKWKESFLSAIKSLRSSSCRFQRKSMKALRPLLPYVLHEVGAQDFIWVNRDYKPVGVATGEWVRYEDYPDLHIGRDDPVSMLGQAGLFDGRICLFDDGCPPWSSRANAERLALLMKVLLSLDLDLREEGQIIRMLSKVGNRRRQTA